jgi:hypothetical protein
MTVDFSKLATKQKNVTDSEYVDMEAYLAKGVPLIVEVEEILDANTIKACLILGAFRAPPDTRVHVKQAYTHKGMDSLSKHIEGNNYISPLRKGDIVCFDRVFLADGDAVTSRVTSRTHDNMLGNVQFAMGMAKVSASSVTKRGPTQSVTLLDGSQAFQVFDAEDVRAVYEKVCATSWASGEGGFAIRTAARTRGSEYHVSKDRPLAAFIEEMQAQGYLDGQKWLELIPARRFAVSREQVMRDIDIREETAKTYGKVSKQYLPLKSAYPGYRQTGVILCDEEEYAFGGKTGLIHRVVGGIQPLNAEAPIDVRRVPSRIHDQPNKVRPLDLLFQEATMERMANERASRRPERPADKPHPGRFPKPDGRGQSLQSADEYEDTGIKTQKTTAEDFARFASAFGFGKTP